MLCIQYQFTCIIFGIFLLGLHPTNGNKVKRKVQTIKTPKSCSNISINTNDCLIIKSKNALNQSCSISTRLNLTEINESNSDFVNLENNISVCLKIQGLSMFG